MINKTILIGYLGQDVTLKDTGSVKVATTSLAVTEKRKAADGNMINETEWFNLVFFDKKADMAANYLHKGSKVYIEGKRKTNEYTNKEGIKSKSYSIIVEKLDFLDNKKDSDPAPARTNDTNNYSAPQAQMYDEEFPF